MTFWIISIVPFLSKVRIFQKLNKFFYCTVSFQPLEFDVFNLVKQ